MEDLNDKVTGSELSADNWNQPASELQHVIEAMGLTLSGANLYQLLEALSIANAKQGFYVVNGASTATDWVVDPGFGLQQPVALAAGVRVKFIAPNGGTLTAGETLKVGSLAAKAVQTRGGNTPSADTTPLFTAGEVVEFEFDAVADKWTVLSPYPQGLADERGTFQRATTAELTAPLSGGNSAGALTALYAYRSPGWKSINRMLTTDFDFTEGSGINVVTDMTVALDNYDPAIGGDQYYAYKFLVRLSNFGATLDGELYLFVDTDAGSSITVSGTARFYDEVSNSMYVDTGPFRSSDYSSPSVQAAIPDGAFYPTTGECYAILEGVATVADSGRSLYLRAQHTGTGSATVTVQRRTWVSVEKLETP